MVLSSGGSVRHNWNASLRGIQCGGLLGIRHSVSNSCGSHVPAKPAGARQLLNQGEGGSFSGRTQQLKPSRQILPLSIAQLSSATRFLEPVLVNTLLTWLSTVRLLMVRRSAIS